MKKKKFPHTLVIVSAILVIFMILTWIIPSGEYTRIEKEIKTNKGTTEKIKVVDRESYKHVPAAPQGIGAVLTAPIRGIERAAQIIAFVLLVGGAFGIITKTGTINAGLGSIIEFSRRRPQYKHFIIPFVMFLFSLAGASFGMSEEVLVFIMITIPLAMALGYDSLVGIAMPFVGAGVGFAGAFSNPFTIGIAQGISEIPIFSGWEYRILVWLVFTTIAITFVMIYARKVEKNKERSVVYELDKQRDMSIFHTDEDLTFTTKRKVVLSLLGFAIIMLVVGVNVWDWYINDIAGLFIALGVVTAFFYRLKPNETVSAFVDGARDMMTAALVIGLTRGMLIIATEGKIIDTILFSIAGLAEGLPKILSVQIMFVFQCIMNFFVPSGSGQAALTMPLMAPLSDLIGITRQTAVLAYQLGDGLFTMIFPTSGVTMGILAIGKIPYDKWIRFIIPLSAIFFIVAMLMLIPPVLFFTWN